MPVDVMRVSPPGGFADRAKKLLLPNEVLAGAQSGRGSSSARAFLSQLTQQKQHDP
jgi:hypothetical protein